MSVKGVTVKNTVTIDDVTGLTTDTSLNHFPEKIYFVQYPCRCFIPTTSI
jgi:hypothetical protein